MSDEPTCRQNAAVARKAADVIQARGKATGEMVDAHGRVCAHGALIEAGRGYSASCRLFVLDRVILLRAAQPLSLAAWSDLPTTTAADIAKLFLQVADDLEVAP